MFIMSLNFVDSSRSQLCYYFKLHTSDFSDKCHVLCSSFVHFSFSSWLLLCCVFVFVFFFLSHCLKPSLDQEWGVFLWLKCYQIKTEFRYANPHVIRLHGLWAITLPAAAGDKRFVNFSFLFSLIDNTFYLNIQTNKALSILKTWLGLKTAKFYSRARQKSCCWRQTTQDILYIIH